MSRDLSKARLISIVTMHVINADEVQWKGSVFDEKPYAKRRRNTMDRRKSGASRRSQCRSSRHSARIRNMSFDGYLFNAPLSRPRKYRTRYFAEVAFGMDMRDK